MSGGINRFMHSDQRTAQQTEATALNARSYKRPDCGAPTHFMGLDFKAPKRSDAKAWHQVQVFIQSGKVYYRGSQNAAAEG
jgi:hypothetical protein